MPRFSRNYLETSSFHIITQGINKSYIFNQEEDIKYYINTIYKLKEEHNIKIIAYCVMNNHTHMLLETDKILNLSKYMLRLNTIYGKYYNKKYNRVGYVFRNRYKSEGIYTWDHLYNCINYIYNNPVKAGLCKYPCEYPYSNYKKINQTCSETSYTFLDVEDNKNDLCKTITNNFLQENNLSLEGLIKNKDHFKELIIILKDKNDISLRLISRTLNIGRETIRKIYNS